MTLEEKVGQLLLIGFDDTRLTPELSQVIQELHIGGIVFYERNVASPRAVVEIAAGVQAIASQNGDPGLFVTIDQEGGIVARLKEDKGFTEFPGQMAVAATGQVESARRLAQAHAAELRALGFNMDLAPVLDVNNNPDNPIIGTRSFGSNPAQVATFGVSVIQAMQSAGVMAVGKHFPGHGDTGTDSHIALPTVPHSRARLESVEFVPFRAAIQSGIAGIMSAHITFPAIDATAGLPATLSPKVLTGLLRDEMKYDGLVMTDELGMGALGASGYPPPQAAVRALQAGADVLLFNRGYDIHREAFRQILEGVKRGTISMSRVNDAVLRILRAKQQYGLLTPPQVSVEQGAALAGALETKQLSREVALQSVTLLRDDAGLVPLPTGEPVLVIETASNLGLGKALGATTFVASAQPKADEIRTALSLAARRVVVVATTDVFRNRQQVDLVRGLLKAHVPTVVVAMRAPYDLLYLGDAPTYLAAYGITPPVVEAVAAILLGKTRPQGRLPVELPGMYMLGEGLR